LDNKTFAIIDAWYKHEEKNNGQEYNETWN